MVLYGPGAHLYTVYRPLAENRNFRFIGLNGSEAIYTVRFMPVHDDLTPKKSS